MFSGDHSIWSPKFCVLWRCIFILSLILLMLCEKSLIFSITLILFQSIEALETKLLLSCGVINNVSFLLEILKQEYDE